MKTIRLILLSFTFTFCLNLSAGAQELSDVLNGLEPQLYQPGLVTTGDFEYGSSLSADEQMFAFVKAIDGFQRSVLVYTEKGNSRWKKPKVFSFSGEWHDTNPYFHEPSGRFYFTSRRPSGQDGVGSSNLWYLPLNDLENGEPKLLEGFNDQYPVIYPTIDAERNVRFCSFRPGGEGGLDLYISTFTNGKYSEPQPIAELNSPQQDADPEVSPDGRLLVYTSQREGGLGHYDLYICTKQEDGKWSAPINLGPKVNSPQMDSDPIFSKDGTRLFFSSRKVKPMMKRPEKVTSYEQLRSSLQSPDNGLMNIYVLDVQELTAFLLKD